ncbi:MAG: putative dsRNA-binding protein, partial [Chloroflexota bacterium]|nr:putative dsRNA-binding protein [Chloroflexota bacterium]
EMTRRRAALVRQDTLASIARTIRLGEYLCLGKGERASGGQQKPANLARTLEAVIAAIFLDQGITVTRDVTLKLFDEELQAVASHGAEVDYKSQLQEFIQARGQPKPIYQVVAATGPDHEKQFTIEVKIGDAVLGTGSGKSKKLAEAEAAHAALQRLQSDFTH